MCIALLALHPLCPDLSQHGHHTLGPVLLRGIIHKWHLNRDPNRAHWRPGVMPKALFEIRYYRVMGQTQPIPFVILVCHVLKKNEAWVSQDQIDHCLKVVGEFNHWFPEEGSLDLESWFRIRWDVEKALRQGKKLPLDFWTVWFLIRAAVNMVQDNGPVMSLR